VLGDMSKVSVDVVKLGSKLMDQQVTGCVNPETLDRINPGDAGGQYDSSGGSSGTGNPVDSVCTGCVVCSSQE